MKYLSLLVAGVAMVSGVAAAQEAMPLDSNTPAGQMAPANQFVRPPGPPPNVQKAIELLDQAKQQTTPGAMALIEQAETLLKQPPPLNRMHDNMAGMQGQPPQPPQGGMPQAIPLDQ